MTEQIPAAEAPKTRSSKRFIIIGAAAGLVVALAGAGAFAWQKLDGGGKQPHDVLPSSVVAYARVDADPSASQKIAILRLVRKFPDLAKELGIKDVDQDVRKPLLKDLVEECDLDYDKDVEPWLGDRLGVAYDGKLDSPIVAVKVTDEDKARTGINKLADCGGPDAKTGIAFLDGYALVTPRKADAAKVVSAAEKKALNDNTAYTADMDKLGEKGVFSAWADLEAISKLEAIDEALGADAQDAFAGASTAAFTLRAGSSSLELASIAHLDKKPDFSDSSNIADLPGDTALAFSISGFGDQVRDQFESGFMSGLTGNPGGPEAKATPAPVLPPEPTASPAPVEAPDVEIPGVEIPSGDEGIEGELASIEDETGLEFPEDLVTLLGDGLTFAVGGRNLETIPTMSGPQDLAQLDIGLKLTTDPTKGADLAKRLVALAAKEGFALTATPTDDGVVIATNSGAAKAFSGEGNLGKSDTFKRTVAHGGAFPALFVNIETIVTALLDSNPPPDVEDVLNELDPLSAFAVSSSYEDELLKATVRLTLD